MRWRARAFVLGAASLLGGVGVSALLFFCHCDPVRPSSGEYLSEFQK